MAGPPVFYLIPGLGADERVFQFLRLHGEVHVLRWLTPQSPTEPLRHYAARLASAVPAGQPCWLVGVSFGGVLAQEVAALRPLARVVLISSFMSPRELPWIGRLARATGLYRLVPTQVLPLLPRVAKWFFGARNGGEYRLLKQILRDTDPDFTRWAVARLLQWPGRPGLPIVRIHGTHDRLLPAGAMLSQHALPGGHLIIISQAVKISRILNELATSC
ncbi:alpha/beta hydrolase [Hymenobacter properus]|uniref:Alpha/beta hydrolase n=1 Tax=Hymenobacter properus TaxID=2791026 RepID=A0A931BJM3_9BACT|nr:alpha/beta hydrolase [Hymenobacter properus]MBF9142706.1 alpha/beta hydrolase [Hymenobacter properus]MBR7721514.1 alpha/beta hydrolase [Microvirga sp. SRT04]